MVEIQKFKVQYEIDFNDGYERPTLLREYFSPHMYNDLEMVLKDEEHFSIHDINDSLDWFISIYKKNYSTGEFRNDDLMFLIKDLVQQEFLNETPFSISLNQVEITSIEGYIEEE